MFATITALLLAAPVPKHFEKVKPPEVRHTGIVERSGYMYLQFEVTNPNAADLHYTGYLSNSFEGGLKTGVIAPMYQVELRKDKDWKTHQVGWCGTGKGPVTIPARGKGTFEALVPEGEWDEARFGVTWFTGADRKTANVARGAVTRKAATPKKLGPDKDASFGTPTGSTFRVNLVGKDWALVAEFDIKDLPYHDGKLPLTAKLKPVKAMFHTGPDVGSFVKPPGGPPRKPIPTDGKFAAVAVKDLTVELVAKERLREPAAYVLVTLSGFKVEDEEFAGLAEFELSLRGPYP
jgi:hypothetical protein